MFFIISGSIAFFYATRLFMSAREVERVYKNIPPNGILVRLDIKEILAAMTCF